MKEADALPLVVTYSSSGDTVFIKFELEKHHRGEQYSLLVDFVREIVDAVLIDQCTQKLAQLLEPSSKVWGDLCESNDKRRRWEEDDDEIFAKVRKRCAALEDLISVYPESQGEIISVDVRISDENDPSRELRKHIEETEVVNSSDSHSEITGGLQEGQDLCDNDSYPPDEKEKIEEEDQANSCYHTTQMEMAHILKKRIETIMRH